MTSSNIGKFSLCLENRITKSCKTCRRSEKTTTVNITLIVSLHMAIMYMVEFQ